MRFITVIADTLGIKDKQHEVTINIENIVSFTGNQVIMTSGNVHDLTNESMIDLKEVLSITYEQLVAIETVTKIQVTKDSVLIFNIERLPISEKQLRDLRERLIENFKCNCIVLQPGIKLEAIIDNSELTAEFKEE